VGCSKNAIYYRAGRDRGIEYFLFLSEFSFAIAYLRVNEIDAFGCVEFREKHQTRLSEDTLSTPRGVAGYFPHVNSVLMHTSTRSAYRNFRQTRSSPARFIETISSEIHSIICLVRPCTPHASAIMSNDEQFLAVHYYN